MSDPSDPGKKVPENISPEMRRGLSRRGLLTNELRQSGMEAIKQLPSLSPFLKLAMRETPAQRDERLVKNLWQLLTGREPKQQEMSAGMELVKNAKTPDEKGDALVDIMWALCQTKDFEDLKRTDSLLIRGLYKIALDREPTEDEKRRALLSLQDAHETIMRAAADPESELSRSEVTPEQAAVAARVTALEGLFTSLIRSGESVLRQTIGRR